jgi:TPR repeat protein
MAQAFTNHIIKLAGEGNILANFLLAWSHLIGNEVEEIHVAAYRHFRRASVKGYAPADFALGFLLAYGIGVPKNMDKAKEQFKIAADNGLEEAKEFIDADFSKPELHQKTLNTLSKIKDNVLKQFISESIADSMPTPDETKILSFDTNKEEISPDSNQGATPVAPPSETNGNEPAPAKTVNFLDENIKSKGLSEIFKMAEQGDPFSQNELGSIFLEGVLVARDTREAMKWFTKATEQGLPEAILNLAKMYAGILAAEFLDYEKAAALYEILAESGDAMGQYNLALYMITGQGVPMDRVKAFEWLNKAADQDLIFAKFQLGLCYFRGLGTSKDFSKYEKYMTEAAEAGIPIAQYHLGSYYLLGQFTPINNPLAFKWISRAAESGFDEALQDLGGMYLTGDAGVRDVDKGLKLMKRAADQNCVRSLFLLGKIYSSGQFIPVDMEQANIYMAKAAESGHPEGMLEMAKKYLLGDGFPKNYELSAKYLTLCAEQGMMESVHFLQMLHKGLNFTPEDPDLKKRYLYLIDLISKNIFDYHNNPFPTNFLLFPKFE